MLSDRPQTAYFASAGDAVLILVLMEYALWSGINYYHLGDSIVVLILVLMEYALW